MALFATMLVGIYQETPWLIYLPIFGLGVVLAANHDRVAERAGHVHDWQWGLLSVAAVAFLLIDNLTTWGWRGLFAFSVTAWRSMPVGCPSKPSAGAGR